MNTIIKKNPLLFYILSLIVFGFNGIVAGNISLSSYHIVFFRTFIGSVLLTAIYLLSGGKITLKQNKKDYLFIALSGVSMGISWMFLFEAYKNIGVSLSTLMYYVGPVIVMVFSPIVFGEKLTLGKIAGFIIVIIGLFFINGIGNDTAVNLWGMACGILSAITYFFMIAFNKQAKNVGGLENTVIQLIAAFVTVTFFIVFKADFNFSIPLYEWFWVAVIGIVNSGFACYFYFATVNILPAQTVAIFGYLDLVVAVLAATLILGERLSLMQIIGGIFIVGGAIAGEKLKFKQK